MSSCGKPDNTDDEQDSPTGGAEPEQEEVSTHVDPARDHRRPPFLAPFLNCPTRA